MEVQIKYLIFNILWPSLVFQALLQELKKHLEERPMIKINEY